MGVALQALVYPQHIGHLWGDVLALFVVAIILTWLTPRRIDTAASGPAASRA